VLQYCSSSSRHFYWKRTNWVASYTVAVKSNHIKSVKEDEEEGKKEKQEEEQGDEYGKKNANV